jgi:hypothetical protein
MLVERGTWGKKVPLQALAKRWLHRKQKINSLYILIFGSVADQRK